MMDSAYRFGAAGDIFRQTLRRGAAAFGAAALFAAGACPGEAPARGAGFVPAESSAGGLELAAPIAAWDEAVPLGNGMLGGLLWGSGNTVYLSLDRGDLWDETAAPELSAPDWNLADMMRLIRTDFAAYDRKYGMGPHNHPTPTKIPGGTLMLTFAPGKKSEAFTLDLEKAVGAVRFGDGSGLECFFPASERIALILADGGDVRPRFLRPPVLNTLRYGPAEFGSDGEMEWMVQKAAGGLAYATLTATRRAGGKTLIAAAITTNAEDPDPLGLAKRRARRALDAGFAKMKGAHEKWWRAFWAVSDIDIPDRRLRRLYNLCKYYYGSASRPDAPSIPLQAVWTQNNGALPPWKGDFHHDLNTEATYLPYHKAGLTDCGLSFINHMWRLLPKFRKFAKSFYGVDGTVVPAVMTLNGMPICGWAQYALSPVFSIWIGHSFYLHWKHTMDGAFLRDRAYPWMDGVMRAISGLLKERDGRLYLPLSSSSEIFDDTKRAYLTPNSNQDLSMMHWGFEAAAEMARALGRTDDAERWLALRGKLDDLHVDAEGALMFSSDEPFTQSHRHHALMMAIHPFGTLNIDGSDRDRRIIDATIRRTLKLGYKGLWTGYSFAWFSSILARAGMPESALEHLIYFERAFILRNGFHVNGDMLGCRLTNYIWRNFTIEGDFLAMEAVHDMLLQSWPVNIAKDPTPVIRLFPAMPWRWHDAGFRDLRAEGGFIVSARRERNATTRFEIRATADGELRLRDNFGGRAPAFSREVKKSGRDFVLPMKAGETLTGTLPRPGSLPPEPEESVRCGERIRRIDGLVEKREARAKAEKAKAEKAGKAGGCQK